MSTETAMSKPSAPPKPPEGRDLAGRFRKGTSGNPGGSSRLRRETSKKYIAACPEAADFLIETMRNESAPLALRVRAAELISLRGLGRIPEAMVSSGEGRAQTLVLVQAAPGTPARDEEPDGGVDDGE